MKMTGTKFGSEDDSDESRHLCSACLSAEIKGKVEFSAKLKFLSPKS